MFTKTIQLLVFKKRYFFPIFGLLFSCIFILAYGIDIPFSDNLTATYHLNEIQDTNRMSLSHFWEAYNVHRICTTKLLIYLSFFFKPINQAVILIIILSQIIHAICLYLLFRVIEKQGEIPPFWAFLIAVLFFTPNVTGNWTFAFNIQYYLGNLGFFLSFYSIIFSKNNIFVKNPLFWSGIIISYLSMTHWMAFLPVITILTVFRYMADKGKNKNQHLFNLIFFIPIICILLYLYMIDLPVNAGWSINFKIIGTIFLHLTAFIGNPFTIKGGMIIIPLIMGFSFIILTTYSLFKIRKKKVTHIEGFSLMLISFTIFSGLLVSFGRSHVLGIENAIWSRYVVISIPAWIGLIILIIKIKPLSKIVSKILTIIFISILMLSFIRGASTIIRDSNRIQIGLTDLSKVLNDYNIYNTEISKKIRFHENLFPDLKLLFHYSQQMKKKGIVRYR